MYNVITPQSQSLVDFFNHLPNHVLSWMQSKGIQSCGCKVLVCCVASDLVAFLDLRAHEQSWDVHTHLIELTMTKPIPEIY